LRADQLLAASLTATQDGLRGVLRACIDGGTNAYLSDGGTWVNASDRALKTGFVAPPSH